MNSPNRNPITEIGHEIWQAYLVSSSRPDKKTKTISTNAVINTSYKGTVTESYRFESISLLLLVFS